MPSAFPLDLIIDAFDEPVLLIRNSRVVVANDSARRLLGPAIVDRDIRVALRQPQALAAIIAAERADLDVAGIGGADRPWTLSIRPLGKNQLLVRLHDRSEAIAAERMRVDFVANASHELRTPLATISGYAETLGEVSIPDALRKRFATTIGTESTRMLRIIEDLMSLSRIEADRFRQPRESVALDRLANIAALQIAPLAERRECEVIVAIEREGIQVLGDSALLLQALDNLLSNAIRYGGGANGPVTMTIGMKGSHPFISVADKGRGISAEHLPRLTERFYRVDEARSRGSGGTGLGLAIVKHIVERHRAKLEIRSNPGNGSSFTILFPSKNRPLS
jgi:two-component system phosphate regulon sensor histidine kinase PhoR